MKQNIMFLILTIVYAHKKPSYRVAYMDAEGDGIVFVRKAANLKNEGSSTALVLKGTKYPSSLDRVRTIYTVNTAVVNTIMVRIVNIDLDAVNDPDCEFNTLTVMPPYLSGYKNDTNQLMKYCTEDHMKRNETLIFRKPLMTYLVGDFYVPSRDTTSIELVVLVFREGPCIDQEFNFPCKRGICISKSLVCDGYDHCGEREDELEPSTQCEYIPKFCNGKGTVTYILQINATVVILRGGEISHSNTHESCYAEVLSDIENSYIVLSVRRMGSEYWDIECSTMLQIFTETSGNVTFCNTNKTAAENTLYLEGNQSVKIYSFVMLGQRSEYEIMVLASRNGPCDGDFNFTCENGRCISNNLVCDGYSHCDDGTDESFFYAGCLLLPQQVFTGVAGVGLGLGILIVIVVTILILVFWCGWRRNSNKDVNNKSYTSDQKSNTTTTLASDTAANPLPDVEEIVNY